MVIYCTCQQEHRIAMCIVQVQQADHFEVYKNYHLQITDWSIQGDNMPMPQGITYV